MSRLLARYWASLLLLFLVSTTVASCVLVYRAEARTSQVIDQMQYRPGAKSAHADQTLDQYRLDLLENRMDNSEREWKALIEKNTKEREWIGMLLIANLASVVTALLIWVIKRRDRQDED